MNHTTLIWSKRFTYKDDNCVPNKKFVQTKLNFELANSPDNNVESSNNVESNNEEVKIKDNETFQQLPVRTNTVQAWLNKINLFVTNLTNFDVSQATTPWNILQQLDLHIFQVNDLTPFVLFFDEHVQSFLEKKLNKNVIMQSENELIENIVSTNHFFKYFIISQPWIHDFVSSYIYGQRSEDNDLENENLNNNWGDLMNSILNFIEKSCRKNIPNRKQKIIQTHLFACLLFAIKEFIIFLIWTSCYENINFLSSPKHLGILKTYQEILKITLKDDISEVESCSMYCISLDVLLERLHEINVKNMIKLNIVTKEVSSKPNTNCSKIQYEFQLPSQEAHSSSSSSLSSSSDNYDNKISYEFQFR